MHRSNDILSEMSAQRLAHCLHDQPLLTFPLRFPLPTTQRRESLSKCTQRTKGLALAPLGPARRRENGPFGTRPLSSATQDQVSKTVLTQPICGTLSSSPSPNNQGMRSKDRTNRSTDETAKPNAANTQSNPGTPFTPEQTPKPPSPCPSFNPPQHTAL